MDTTDRIVSATPYDGVTPTLVDPANTTQEYRWPVDNTDVEGETASIREVSGDEAGKTIGVRVSLTYYRDDK